MFFLSKDQENKQMECRTQMNPFEKSQVIDMSENCFLLNFICCLLLQPPSLNTSIDMNDSYVNPQ